MKSNSRVTFDRQLYIFCQHAAVICNSSEFKKLHKEISKLYRKKGIQNSNIIAFQDSLYSLYMEQHDGEFSSQSQLP